MSTSTGSPRSHSLRRTRSRRKMAESAAVRLYVARAARSCGVRADGCQCPFDRAHQPRARWVAACDRARGFSCPCLRPRGHREGSVSTRVAHPLGGRLADAAARSARRSTGAISSSTRLRSTSFRARPVRRRSHARCARGGRRPTDVPPQLEVLLDAGLAVCWRAARRRASRCSRRCASSRSRRSRSRSASTSSAAASSRGASPSRRTTSPGGGSAARRGSTAPSRSSRTSPPRSSSRARRTTWRASCGSPRRCATCGASAATASKRGSGSRRQCARDRPTSSAQLRGRDAATRPP